MAGSLRMKFIQLLVLTEDVQAVTDFLGKKQIIQLSTDDGADVPPQNVTGSFE